MYMNQKTIILIGGIVVVLVVAGAASRYIGKSAAEKAIGTATGGNASVDANGDVTVKTDQGTWSSSDKLPADFPTDVPVYSGATIKASVAGVQEPGGGHFVGLETADSTEKVITWYTAQVAANGWKISADATYGDSTIISSTKDTRDLAVTVSTDSGKTIIGLVVTQK